MPCLCLSICPRLPQRCLDSLMSLRRPSDQVKVEMLWLRVEAFGVVVQRQWQLGTAGISLLAQRARPRDASCQDVQGSLSDVLAGTNPTTEPEAGEVLQVGVLRQRLPVCSREVRVQPPVRAEAVRVWVQCLIPMNRPVQPGTVSIAACASQTSAPTYHWLGWKIVPSLNRYPLYSSSLVSW